ncbi:glycosyltransferase [Flavobacterium sp. LPB0248]|uniref:glycosyltransferase n=1 Tax=Flavobacterium sp. LPB0248 TaxID=2614441 RepID=UPI0015A54812|nr:glycosyltransferase [Flavobacterium sp. LPB0248]QLC67484.1 glycosyltransferase [Flavobacterium sp. LPB0248]
MKILQLGKAFPPIKKLGGVEKVMEYFYYGLNESGIKCDVLGANDKNSRKIDKYCEEGLVYRESLLFKAKSTFFSISLIFRLWKIKDEYDIIHVHLPDPMALLALFLTRPKSKIIVHWHSNILKQKYAYLIIKYFETWVLKKSDLILCTTPNYSINNKVLKSFINKVSYVVIGLDIDKSLFSSQTESKINENYQTKKKLIYVGRFVYYKGIEFLIQAMSLIESDCVLFLIGDGEMKIQMENLVSELKISDKVIFLGEVDDSYKFSYIKSSDMLVLPSLFKTEAYGIVQVEAMALGVPVLSTKIEGSGVDWVNKDSESGVIVTPGKSKEIAKAIDKVFSNPEFLMDISEGAKKRYETLFTKEKMINQVVSKYNEVLKK